jgi:predicted lysophospholipase L1 biosynthesis ABC-type transport system permease subunit
MGAVALSWAVARYLLDIPWHPALGTVAAGILLTGVLVGLVGVVTSLDVVRRKPLGVLRAE